MGVQPNQKLAARAVTIKPLDQVPISIEYFNGDKYIAADGKMYPGYSPVVVGQISLNPDDENYINQETWEALVYDAYYDIDAYVNKAMTVLGIFNLVPNFSNIPVITKDHMMKAVAAKIEQNLFTNPSNAEIRVTLTQNSGGRTTNLPARENFNPTDLLNQKVQEYINGSNIIEVLEDSFKAIVLDRNDYYTRNEIDALFANETLAIEKLFTLDVDNWKPTNPGDGVNKKYIDAQTNEIWETLNKLVVGDIKIYTDKIYVKDQVNESMTGAAVTQNDANTEFKAAINKNKTDATFLDGTLPRAIDLTKDDDGSVELRAKGPTYIFGSDGYFTTDAGTKTTHIVFDDTDSDPLKWADLDYKAQDDGKLKLNNIGIFDANETTFNIKELVVKNGGAITLGGVKRTTWPTGGGSGGGVTLSSELGDDSSSKPNDGINSWKTKLDTFTDQTAPDTYAKVANYNNDTGSKAILNATNGDEMEFKVGELSPASFLLEKTGINMLNGQIVKTNKATANDELINQGEMQSYVQNILNVSEWKTLVPTNIIKEVPIKEFEVEIDDVYTDGTTDDGQPSPTPADAIFYGVDGNADEITYGASYFLPLDSKITNLSWRVKLDVSDDIYTDNKDINPKFKVIDIETPLIDGHITQETFSVIEYVKSNANAEIDIKKTIEFKDVFFTVRKDNVGWFLSLTNDYKENGIKKSWSDRKVYIQHVKGVNILSGGNIDLTGYYTKTETDNKFIEKLTQDPNDASLRAEIRKDITPGSIERSTISLNTSTNNSNGTFTIQTTGDKSEITAHGFYSVPWAKELTTSQSGAIGEISNRPVSTGESQVKMGAVRPKDDEDGHGANRVEVFIQSDYNGVAQALVRAADKDNQPVDYVPNATTSITTKSYVDAKIRLLAKELGISNERIMELFPEEIK